jgi:hypothetical protein
MENLNNSPYFFDEEVKVIAYCPVCEADINPIKAKIVENKEDLNLVHIQCSKCKGNILALILRTSSGLSSIGLMTDLNFNDIFKFKEHDSLADNEIISFHKKIRKKNFINQIINQSK